MSKERIKVILMEAMYALENKNVAVLKELLEEINTIEKKFPEYEVECAVCKELIRIIEKKIDEASKYVI